jgi:hypothetical protein
VVVPDWLHEVLKLGDPDLASAVFPARMGIAVSYFLFFSQGPLGDLTCIILFYIL